MAECKFTGVYNSVNEYLGDYLISVQNRVS